MPWMHPEFTFIFGLGLITGAFEGLKLDETYPVKSIYRIISHNVTGTGVCIEPDTIITNSHVVGDSK